MLSLAAKFDEGPVAASEIALEQRLSRKYLDQILRDLRDAGIVLSTRGIHGGYYLSRSPADITLFEILDAMEENLDIVHCTSAAFNCAFSTTCATREVWVEIKIAVMEILCRTTLSDLESRMAALSVQTATRKGD